MKSLAVCVLILAVVGLSSCASRHRRQGPAIPDGVIPADAATAVPAQSPLNDVVELLILKENAKSDLTGAVDPAAVKKIQTLSLVIQLTGDTVSEDNQQGLVDLQDKLAAQEAAAAEAAAAAAAAEPAADPATV